MPAERIGMRDAREIIRLKFSGVSTHEIARRLGMARSTVRETLKRADGAGLAWPLPEAMTDGPLEAALYASRRSKRGHRRIAEPDWASVHREVKRKHVTLLILWDEYIATSPGGYSYSRFCELYRSFEKTLSVTMRQTHAAGERLFVDYAGDGVPVVVDRLTGEIRMAQIFVAVLGASSFTFAKATWTQALPDWIDAHVRAFEAIGGVPELVVPDNARTAIVKASFYDPEVNRTYAEMAAHYRTAILPARPRKPRDKAKVEQAVLIVERWLLGRLRRRVFHSLADVDAALGELMIQLNERQPLRRLAVTRRQLLEEIDRPALRALPDEPYEYSEWRLPRVGVDYHVEIDAHYYSVPYRFARAEVEARVTARGVEIFHKGERIAVHGRSLVRYHLHPESKFRGGDYDQHGALRRRHVIAFAMQAIGKESDDIEENEFIGEDAGPMEHPMASSSNAKVAAFVAETQQTLGASDRELLGHAKVSPHSLKHLRAGKRVGDDLLHRLASAAERLRLERGPALAEREKWLQIARELMINMGGRNKLAAVLSVSGPYLGRVLGGKKPMTAEMIGRLKALSAGQLK